MCVWAAARKIVDIYVDHDMGDTHQSFAKAIPSDGHSYQEVLISLHFLLWMYCCKLLSYVSL